MTRNVYKHKTDARYETSRSVPIAERVSEAQIDILIAGRNHFHLLNREIADRADYPLRIVASVLSKNRYCSKEMYADIDRAMVDIVLEDMGLTRQQFMAQMRAKQNSLSEI